MRAGCALFAQRLRDRCQPELCRHGCVIPPGYRHIVRDDAIGGVGRADNPNRLLVAHRGDRIGRLGGR
jgi:hypothetical protein